MRNKPFDHRTFKREFDKHLSDYFLAKKRSLDWVTDKAIASYIDQVAAITLADGKRIRPYLGYLGYKISGGRMYDGLMEALVAIELFHAFALIHDDIIDKATLRHGRPTIHAAIAKAHGRAYGDSQAMLVGDMVQAWAHKRLIRYTKPRLRAEVHALFSDMIEEVVVGQMIDVSLTVRESVTESLLLEKNRLKTARYSFVHPLAIGGALAGSRAFASFFGSFGETLGIGFQVQDDLIDIAGIGSGKAPMTDIAEGQHTHLTQWIFGHGSASDRAMLRSHFGKPVNAKTATLLRDLFERTGAIAHTRQIIGRHMDAARALLQSSAVRQPYKDMLAALVDGIASRSS